MRRKLKFNHNMFTYYKIKNKLNRKFMKHARNFII